MEPSFCAVVVFGLVLLALFMSVRRVMRRSGLATAGRRLDLQPTTSGLFGTDDLHGEVSGHRVRVYALGKNAGATRRASTRYEAHYRDVGLSLDIRPRLGRVPEKRSGFETGDHVFDAKFEVGGKDPARVVAFLTAARRQALIEAARKLTHLRVADDRASCEEPGIETNAVLMGSRLDLLVAIARTFSADDEQLVSPDRRGPRKPEPPVVETEPDDGPDDPVERAARFLSGDPDDRVTLTLERSEAETRVATPDEVIPPPLPVVEDPPEPEPPAPAVPPPLPKAAGAGPSMEALATELFAPGVGMLAGERHFADHHAGRRVSWRGRLGRVERYQVDLVFRDGPGVRAEAVLDHDRGEGLGARPIRVVVDLPEARFEAASSLTGEPVLLRGTLVRCDLLGRRLHLADGEIARIGR